jgi:hypothetical protein
MLDEDGWIFFGSLISVLDNLLSVSFQWRPVDSPHTILCPPSHCHALPIVSDASMLRNARNDSPAEPEVCKSIVVPDFLLKSAHAEQDKSAHSFYSGIVKVAPGRDPSTWIFFVQSSNGSVKCLIQTSYSASCCVLADSATRARSAWLGR